MVNSAGALQQLVPACALTFFRKQVNVFNTLSSVSPALVVMFYPFAALFYERLWQAMSTYDYMGRKFVPNYTKDTPKLFAQNKKACEIYWVIERCFVEVAFQKIRVANASQNWMQKEVISLMFYSDFRAVESSACALVQRLGKYNFRGLSLFRRQIISPGH